MATYISGAPAIQIEEKDLATFINPVSTTVGAIVCNFNWGPCLEPVLITNEDELVRVFGKPDNNNYKDWFCAKNFLSYSDSLYAVRTINESAVNSCDVLEECTIIKSLSDFNDRLGTFSQTTKTAKVFGRYPGIVANGIRVVIADKQTIEAEGHILAPYVDQLLNDNSAVCGVFDKTGAVLEMGVYSFKSDAKNANGMTNFVINAVNNNSSYVYLVENKIIKYDETTGARLPVDVDVTLVGGVDNIATDDDYVNAWNLMKDADRYDISLAMQGGCSTVVGKAIIDNIAAYRKDCMACVSPQQEDVLNLGDIFVGEDRTKGIINSSNALGYSSYRFMDANYKYQYDSYNEVYRWVPLNGDIAGIFSLIDYEKGPWYTPGGYQIKNCIKLAFYPSKGERDILFRYRANTVTSFPNTGHVLWSDQTGADNSTSFNFANIRRMFIYIEKNIGQYAREVMWKQNDEVTRTQFLQTVEPFLRSIQGARGIEDYIIVCDDSVNTPDVVMRGQFVAKIYIKPIYSIRYVLLYFTSTRSDVSFNEVMS